MEKRERAVCGTLCLCLAVAVMSAVALVYLTVIIYLPSQREMSSGINEIPVMCTTTERKAIKDDILACKWSSCSEWCLSKGGGACTHLYVSVRNNGSNVEFEECTDIVHKTCPSLDRFNLQKKNCKKDHQCTQLDRTFRCEGGKCWNITDVYSCSWTEKGPELNCEKKRNCVDLEGMYDCHAGRCGKIEDWKCERRCADIESPGKNVIIMSGDEIVLGNCRRAVSTNTGETLWDSNDAPDTTLLASCTILGGNGTDYFRAQDCINGSLLQSQILGKEPTNLTTLQDVFHKLGHENKLDPTAVRFPYEDDILIFNQSRLMINLEGCVNTLQEECTKFYEIHGNDGRNHSAPSRYPCYYAPADPTYVVARYNLQHTRWLFLIFFIVPASLLILSCGVLFTCSRILNVDNSGHMNLDCCNPGTHSELSSSHLQFKSFEKDADHL